MKQHQPRRAKAIALRRERDRSFSVEMLMFPLAGFAVLMIATGLRLVS